MTRIQRIRNIVGGLFLILSAFLMAKNPPVARLVIIMILGITALIAGIRKLVYYFAMAQYSVGGKAILYQAFILLDLGIFTINLADIRGMYIMIYLLIGYLFYGAINIARAIEIKKSRNGKWWMKLVIGIWYIALTVLCLTQLRSEQMMVYIYCLGLIVTGIGRIITAFSKTAVLYVQQA